MRKLTFLECFQVSSIVGLIFGTIMLISVIFMLVLEHFKGLHNATIANGVEIMLCWGGGCFFLMFIPSTAICAIQRLCLWIVSLRNRHKLIS